MKIQSFNSSSLPKTGGRGRTSARAISISSKGVFHITPASAELIGIGKDDKVSFAHDQEDGANWYVYKDKEGYAVGQHSDKKAFTMCHQELAKIIRASLSAPEGKSILLSIAGKPTQHGAVKYWGLIHVKKSI